MGNKNKRKTTHLNVNPCMIAIAHGHKEHLGLNPTVRIHGGNKDYVTYLFEDGYFLVIVPNQAHNKTESIILYDPQGKLAIAVWHKKYKPIVVINDRKPERIRSINNKKIKEKIVLVYWTNEDAFIPSLAIYLHQVLNYELSNHDPGYFEGHPDDYHDAHNGVKNMASRLYKGEVNELEGSEINYYTENYTLDEEEKALIERNRMMRS